jgi:hypothetical protein
VLESAPAQLNDDDVPEPAVIPESNSGPAAEPASLFAEPVVDAGPALAVESDELAEPSPAAESEFRYDPIDFSRVSADDPGELQDLDAPEHSPYQAAAAEPSMSSANDFYAAPQGYSALDQAPQSVVAEQAEPAEVTTPDPFDDLLLDPADAERPPGPSPVDLPKLDPPPLAVPVASAFTGFGVPAQPRAFGGAPAGWPPPGWPPSPESFDDDAQHNAGSDQARSYQPTEIFAQDNQPAGRYVGRRVSRRRAFRGRAGRTECRAGRRSRRARPG